MDESFENVIIGTSKGQKLAEGESITVESVDGTTVKIDASLDPEVACDD